MTSYFDAHARHVYEAGAELDGGLETVRGIEAEVFREVSLCTGDREFPADLREQVMAAFAVLGVWQPEGCPANEAAVERFRATGISEAIECVHSLFHELARRRVQARFGLWSDSPSQNLVLRDEHDAERVARAERAEGVE
jgi:hypothetical protein